jgi:hypothetical protein
MWQVLMLVAAGLSDLWHRRRAIISSAARQLTNIELPNGAIVNLHVAKILAANLQHMSGEQHPGVVAM